MKKLIYLTAVAGSLLLTTSCVDLTQEPESFITEEEYWNTVDQASLEKAADALYSDLWQGNYGFNSRLQRINVCADDITYRAAKANNELAYYSRLTPNLTANDADFSTTWTLTGHSAVTYIHGLHPQILAKLQIFMKAKS